MGSAPQAPVVDPNSINSSQEGYNTLSAEEAATLSNVNQQTPFGNLTYTPTGIGPGGVPSYTATTQLSPQEQYLLGTGQTTQGLAATQGAELLGGVNYGEPPDLGTMTSGLTGQMLGSEVGSLTPYFNQQTEQLQSQLANQGLTPTDPAYQVAMNNMLQSQNQSITGFLAQAQPKAFQEALQSYETPLQTAESLYSVGAPGSLSSNLINTPTQGVGSVNAVGAAGVAQQGYDTNAQLAEQQYGSMLSGISNILGAGIKAIPFSDERLKENMHPVGKLDNGETVYVFNYKGSPVRELGVIAQKVEKHHPEAVHNIAGLKAVDYDRLTGGENRYGHRLLSDARAKENIVRAGELYDGQPLYWFNYIGSPETDLGLMAQDVERVIPDAVCEIDGLKHVDYALATERAAAWPR